MSNYLIQGETLTGIADAIRAKSGSSDEIKVSDFATQIEEIEGSGGEEEQPTAVDLSGYDEGVIVETFEDGTTRTSNLEFDSAGNVSKVTADGVETSYSYEFDSEGNVTKISDSNGNATEIIGGDISIGTNVDLVKTTTVLDFSSGDMEVTPNDGEAFSKVSIPKPSTLVAENIAEGIDIAGITGTLSGAELEDTTVTLDFSSGDMAVTAEDGKAFGSVSIPQPETLIAENIAEGVDIAGILGTLSGGGNVVSATGSVSGFSSSSSEITVQHNLGVVPDIIIFLTKSKITLKKSCLQQYIGFSTSFYEKTGGLISCLFTAMTLYSGDRYTYNANLNASNGNSCIDREATAASGRIRNANENSFIVKNGANSWYLDESLTYDWYAFGGLT